MDKEVPRYSYDAYSMVPKQSTPGIGNKKDKKNSKNGEKICKCKCFGSKKSKRKQIFTGLATNLGICVLLFGYTLIGSVIFLAIEGGNNIQKQILATTSLATEQYKSRLNNSSILKTKSESARVKTVENIWEITVSLNILYKDNWTKLAAQEITRFQNELLKSLEEEMFYSHSVQEKESENEAVKEIDWTFARAFLYSLTVLTTVGYGNITPRTSLGKAVTMGYAIFGIPLTLLYLSSIGSILSKIARGVFSRALCCCLCSNCGYCCYDEKRMAEKERRLRKKRQQMELQQQLALQEPFYVRSNVGYDSTSNNLHSPLRDGPLKDLETTSNTDNESRTSMHGLSILAPVLLCLIMMFIYICIGTFILYKLENWNPLDGFYFCFMSLTTIGFGDMMPGSNLDPFYDSEQTIWFCALYIMSGMALTAMCFNVVHDEIIHRIKQQTTSPPKMKSTSFSEDLSSSDPYNLPS